MKTIKFQLLLLALFVMVGCQQDEMSTSIKKGNHSLVATIEGQDYSDYSRTAVDESGNVTWIETDELGVYGNTSENVKYSSTGSGSNVTFTGDLPKTEEAQWAYYPYDENALLSEGNLTITLPDTYVYTGNSNAPMIGKKSDGNLFSFKHLGGLISFTLGGGIPANADRFVVTSIGQNQPIAGKASFATEGDNITMAIVSDEKQSISYDVSSIKDTEEYQHFFVPLPVGTYDKLEVSFYLKDAVEPVFTRSVSNLTVARTDMVSMPILDWKTGEQFMLSEGTKDLSATMTEDITVSLENNTTLEYKNVQEGNEPKVGDVLWSRVTDDFPNGFLGKVSKVTKNSDGSYTVETEVAALSEAFDELYVDETVFLESEEAVTRSAKGKTDVFGFDITSTVSFSAGMENPPIEVEGSFETGRQFQISIMLDKKNKMEQAMITFIDACKLSFSLSAEGTFAEYENKQKLGEIKFKSIPVAYGLIQLTPTITPHFILEANGEICNKASFCQEFVSYTGAEFKNGKWTAGQNRRNKVQGDSPWNFEGELTFSGNLSVGISSDFEIELYDRDDVQVSFAPQISSQLSGEIKIDKSNSTSLEKIIESLKLDASIQFEATVGIDASLLSPDDKLKAEFTLAKVTLAEKELYLVPFFENLLADLHTNEYAETENKLMADVSTCMVGEMLSKETEVSIVVEDEDGKVVTESLPVTYTGAPKVEVIEEGDASPKSEPKGIGIFVENLSQKKEYKAYPVIQSPILEKIVPEGKLVLKDLSVLFKGSGSLREKLIHLYKNAGGENWTNNENWCTNLPIDTWYGVYRRDNNNYYIRLDDNNLTGTFVLNDSSIGEISLNGNPDLIGINVAECTSLERLWYDKHVVTSLDVSDCNTLLENGFWQINDVGTTGTYSVLTSLVARNLHSVTSFNNMDRNWELLDLSGCENLESIGHSASEATHIGTLKLSGCKKMTNEGIHWANYNRNVDVLDISGSNGIIYGRAKKEIYAQGNTSVKAVTVGNNMDIVKCNVSGCENLEKIIVSGEYSLLNIEGCVNLSNLELYGDNYFSQDLSLYTNLDTLRCKINTSLNLSKNPKLKKLILIEGSVGELDLSENNELEEIILGNESEDSYADSVTFTKLTLPYNSSLKSIKTNKANLPALDISRSYALETISLYGNNISDPMELDITNNKALKKITMSGKYNISALDAKGLLNLESISISSQIPVTYNLGGCNGLKYINIKNVNGTLDVHDCINLSTLVFNGENLTKLDISGLNNIQYLNVLGTKLTSIDISHCKSLETLYIGYTPLLSLDLSGLSALKEFNCYENGSLSSLNLTGCSSLEEWICYDNPQLTDLTLMDNAPLGYLSRVDFSNTKITHEIPDWFMKYSNSNIFKFNFKYEQRYTNYVFVRYDSESKKNIYTYHDKGYGWWFPGEPESGEHKRKY